MNDRLRDALANDRHVQIKDLCEALDLSSAAIRDAIHRGDIEAVSVGTRFRIPPHEARRLLSLPPAPPRPPVAPQPRLVDPDKPARGRPRKAETLATIA